MKIRYPDDSRGVLLPRRLRRCARSLVARGSEVKSSGGSAEERGEQESRGMLRARARWGEEPRDRDLFISLASSSSLLHYPASSLPPALHLLTISSYVSLSLSLRDSSTPRYPPVLSVVRPEQPGFLHHAEYFPSTRADGFETKKKRLSCTCLTNTTSRASLLFLSLVQFLSHDRSHCRCLRVIDNIVRNV